MTSYPTGTVTLTDDTTVDPVKDAFVSAAAAALLEGPVRLAEDTSGYGEGGWITSHWELQAVTAYEVGLRLYYPLCGIPQMPDAHIAAEARRWRAIRGEQTLPKPAVRAESDKFQSDFGTAVAWVLPGRFCVEDEPAFGEGRPGQRDLGADDIDDLRSELWARLVQAAGGEPVMPGYDDVSERLDRLRADLSLAWSQGTSTMPNLWDYRSRLTAGQGTVTALLVQQKFGGDLIRTMLPASAVAGMPYRYRAHVAGDGPFVHFYNRLPDGREVDLTREQFNAWTPVAGMTSPSREEILADPETAHRFQVLAARYEG
jgi:hypothetical protein